MPLIGRLIMAFALVALGLGVLYVGMSGIGKVVGAVGSTVGGFVDGVTATATPVASVLPISDAPLIEAPEEPYTTADSVDLVITVPSDLAGDADYRLRIYLALKDQAPAPIDEVAIAATPTTIVPVELTKGVNDFTVTIVGSERRIRAVRGRPLLPGPGPTQDHHRVTEERGDRQPQGGRDHGQDPGPLHAHRPQRRQRRVHHRQRRRPTARSA